MTADLTIAEQVAEHHGAPPGRLPSGVAEAFAAEQRDLAAAGLPSVTAGPGDRMPDGNLLDVAGQPTSLAEALGSGPGRACGMRSLRPSAAWAARAWDGFSW